MQVRLCGAIIPWVEERDEAVRAVRSVRRLGWVFRYLLIAIDEFARRGSSFPGVG